MSRAARLASSVALALGMAIAPPAPAQESPREVINPPTLPNSVQYGYSQANAVRPGTRMVFVAGQVGFDPAGPNDFPRQVDRAFENLRLALAAAGARPEDVVKITLLVVDHDPDRLATLGAARRAFFGAAPPASTLIPVPRLYAEGVTFEVDAVTVAPAR